TQHRQARFSEVLASAGQYAAFGAGFGALDYGLNKGMQKLSEPSAVRDVHSRTSSSIGDGNLEGKTINFRDDHDMKNPFHPLNNLAPTTHPPTSPRPPLGSSPAEIELATVSDRLVT